MYLPYSCQFFWRFDVLLSSSTLLFLSDIQIEYQTGKVELKIKFNMDLLIIQFTGLIKTYPPPRKKKSEILGPSRWKWVPAKVHLKRKMFGNFGCQKLSYMNLRLFIVNWPILRQWKSFFLVARGLRWGGADKFWINPAVYSNMTLWSTLKTENFGHYNFGHLIFGQKLSGLSPI